MSIDFIQSKQFLKFIVILKGKVEINGINDLLNLFIVYINCFYSIME